jgi:hypothetical protein
VRVIAVALWSSSGYWYSIVFKCSSYSINPFIASCENTMTLSGPGLPASCKKFPHSSQVNFWSTESIFNQFSVFVKTLKALCVCLQYKHLRSMERVIRSDKPLTLFLLLWSHKCDFGAEPRSRIIATSAVKGLRMPAMIIASFTIHKIIFTFSASFTARYSCYISEWLCVFVCVFLCVCGCALVCCLS